MVRFELVIAIIFGLHRDFDFNHVIYGFIKIIAIISGPALYKCIKINPLNNLYSHGFHSIKILKAQFRGSSKNFSDQFCTIHLQLMNYWMTIFFDIVQNQDIKKSKLIWFDLEIGLFRKSTNLVSNVKAGFNGRPSVRTRSCPDKVVILGRTFRIGPDHIHAKEYR